MRLASVPIGVSGSSSIGRIAASIADGSISGSSPCTLTMSPACGMSRGDLRHTIGAREMIGSGHRYLRPEAPRFCVDSLVVGRDHDARKIPRHRNTLVNMLQHGFGADFCESFSGKPRRRVTRRNDTQNFAVHKR